MQNEQIRRSNTPTGGAWFRVSSTPFILYKCRFNCRRTSTRSYSCWIYAVRLSRRAVPISCTCTARSLVDTSSGVPPAVRRPHGRTRTTCTPPLMDGRRPWTSCSGGKCRQLVAPSGYRSKVRVHNGITCALMSHAPIAVVVFVWDVCLYTIVGG